MTSGYIAFDPTSIYEVRANGQLDSNGFFITIEEDTWYDDVNCEQGSCTMSDTIKESIRQALNLGELETKEYHADKTISLYIEKQEPVYSPIISDITVAFPFNLTVDSPYCETMVLHYYHNDFGNHTKYDKFAFLANKDPGTCYFGNTLIGFSAQMVNVNLTRFT